MAWWSGTVTATNGSPNVTVVSGDPIDTIVSGNALVIGNSFSPVEIKRVFFNGTNNIIELLFNWPNATQTAQPAKSFTTDADLIPISKTLATYLSSFTKASQTDAVTGTDNTNVMTALRTKEAIQALVKSAAYLNATMGRLDHTLGRVFKMGDLGMGCTLDLRTSAGGAYADYDTPQKCYNKGTLFGFIDGASLGIPNYSASAYGVLTIHGHYTDASGAMGTCQEFRYGAEVWIRAYASATTWTSWTKLLKTGDYGQGSVGQMPTVPVSDLNLLNTSGDFSVQPNTSNWPFGANGGILRHSSHGNNEYSMQIASEAQNKKTKVRYRQVGGVWTAWTDFMQLGDNGFGTHLQGIKDVMAVQNPSEVLTTVNSSGSDGHYQGMIQNHGSYAPEAYGTLSGFVSANNTYSYTWQEFIGYSSTKWRRNATSSTTWTGWRKVLEQGDLSSAAYLTATTDRATGAVGQASRIGDYGLGSGPVSPPNGDLDQAWVTGFYRQEIPSSGFAYTTTLNMSSNDGRQQLSIARGFNRMAFRSSAFGSSLEPGQFWTPWVDVYHTENILGNVKYPLRDGDGPSAVIERGANANGQYVKLADGTVFAWGRVIQTGLAINPAGRGNHATGHFCDPVMPTTMIDPVVTVGQHALYAADTALLYSLLITSSAGQPTIVNLGTSPNNVWPRLDEIGVIVATKADYRWTAIGRWR